MSRQAFLQNLRTARNIFFHPVGPPSDRADPRDPNTQLARAPIWLSPASVSGFDPAAFGELAPEDRERLRERVREFLEVAKQGGPDDRPSPEMVEHAIPTFLDIVRILEPYLSADRETQKVGEVIESIDLSPGVVTWKFEIGNDSTGDPAVWIWLYVDEEVLSRKEISRVTTVIEQKIHDALIAAGVERWPYVHVRTPAEQRSLGSISV